jgi:hypothetical protein
LITAIKNFHSPKYQPVTLKEEKMMRTNQGAKAYENAINACVEFFSKAGSLYDTPSKRSYYSNETSALALFRDAFVEDSVTSLKLLFWLRDCRGGAGNRSGARTIITHLANTETELMKLNMHLIPVYGRWDDLKALFTSPLRTMAGAFWADAINGGDVLAAKWAKRHYKPIRWELGLKESEFRKMLASIRKDHIVEHKMCQKQWNNIDFKHVPSVAMARYTKAFDNHAHEKFQAYKDAIKSGETTVHAETLFPHDCIRTAMHGDDEMAELQFNALPDYLEGTDEKIMVIADTSGSMQSIIGGSIQAIHVSMGMALYCSSRMPEDSPFYKRFIAFCSEGKFVDWRKHTFKSAIMDRNVFDQAVGSTRIDKALKTILDIAVKKEIPQRLMPTTLLIVSDMQFSDGAADNGYGWDTQGLNEEKSLTEIDRMMNAFKQAGYDRPKIVYWNTNGYEGQQETVNSENVGLVSGFSPSLCKAIFGGDDFTPYAIMQRAIEKYKVKVPTREGIIEV